MIEKLKDVGSGMFGLGGQDLAAVVSKVNEVIDFLNEPVLPEDHPNAQSITALLERLQQMGQVKSWHMQASRPVAPLYTSGIPDPVAFQTGDTVMTFEVVLPGAGIRPVSSRVRPVAAGQ